jgi:hypothetical protein
VKTIRRVLGLGLGLVAGVGLVIFVAGRFSDGPLGFFSGGTFTSGEAMEAIDDWSFARDVETVELQLLEPARSRTVWMIVAGGTAYIPCGLPQFRLWKQWPHDAIENGAGLVRVDERIYPVELVKDEDPDRFAALVELIDEKYATGVSETATADSIWLFRLVSRPDGGSSP